MRPDWYMLNTEDCVAALVIIALIWFAVIVVNAVSGGFLW
jgi:hypothetical protein